MNVPKMASVEMMLGNDYFSISTNEPPYYSFILHYVCSFWDITNYFTPRSICLDKTCVT